MSKPNTRKTRSGRAVKAPDRWEPKEDVIDDFGVDEYDSDDGSDVSSTLSISDDEEDDDDDLDDFIVEDEDEPEYGEEEPVAEDDDDDDESEYCDSDESE